jgi:hypothetical protein
MLPAGAIGKRELARTTGKSALPDLSLKITVSLPCVARLELEDHRVLAVGLDVLDRRNKALAGRLRILAAVNVDGMDDVLGYERLAVVELHALAQLEHPLGGVVRHLPALGQFAHDLTTGC